MDSKINFRLEYILLLSWVKTIIAFHIFGRFKDWDHEAIDFFDKSFNPRNKRDLRLKQTILRYNRRRLKNGNNAD